MLLFVDRCVFVVCLAFVVWSLFDVCWLLLVVCGSVSVDILSWFLPCWLLCRLLTLCEGLLVGRWSWFVVRCLAFVCCCLNVCLLRFGFCVLCVCCCCFLCFLFLVSCFFCVSLVVVCCMLFGVLHCVFVCCCS